MPSSISAYPDLSYYSGIKTGYFYRLFYAYDWLKVANVNPSSSTACIAAFRSWGFYAHTHAYVVGYRLSRNRNITSCESILEY